MLALALTRMPDGTARPVLRDDYPLPVPGPGEALVRVTRAGICSTDLEVLRGYRAFEGVLGHECAGVVASAPDTRAWEGRRVVPEINVGCGICPECLAHGPAHCPRRTALGILGHDGVFAEYVTVPVRNLHAVPASVEDDAAVFVEPLAAACEVLEGVHVRPAQRVAVLGTGRLGALCAQVLALTGCDLLAIGRHPAQLDFLREQGIPVERAPEPWPGALADRLGSMDIVVECTGQAGGFAQARALLRPRGTLVLKSTYHGAAQVDLSALAVDEIAVAGSRCGPFDAAIRLLAAGRVCVLPLIHARYALRDALPALERAGQPGALKVLLTP